MEGTDVGRGMGSQERGWSSSWWCGAGSHG